MSFHLSAEDIFVDGPILRARLRNENGDLNDTEIDLNRFLGNNDGHFQWDGENFFDTAEDVSFHIEGGGEVPVLRARLRTVDGGERDADVNLSERIINDNGNFTFQY